MTMDVPGSCLAPDSRKFAEFFQGERHGLYRLPIRGSVRQGFPDSVYNQLSGCAGVPGSAISQ